MCAKSTMKTRRRRLTGLVWLTAVALASAACSSSDGARVAVEPGALYDQMCARCHGRDGRGDPQMKVQMPVKDLTDPAFRVRTANEEIERLIMTGRNQMPSFGGVISAPKVQAIAGYVRRLGDK
jgi:mono/diheme cytochrome c family protein